MRYAIEHNEKTVWVNDETGCCVGRFQWNGVDVHATGPDQMAGAHCLDCVVGLPFDEAWKRFQASMLTHHGVSVPDQIKPTQRGWS